MTYKIIRNYETNSLEFYDKLENIKDTLTEDEYFKLYFLNLNKQYEINLNTLSQLYNQLNKLKDFENTELIFVSSNINERVNIEALKLNNKLNKSIFKITYEKEFKEFKIGFADYSYVNSYMPQWSTAYVFDHSNHSKLVEPIFTDLKLNSLFVSKLLKDDTSVDNIKDKHELLETKDYFKESSIESISESTNKGLIDTKYFINSNDIINFQKVNTVYIKRMLDVYLSIKISGIYKNTFISEDVILNNNSIVKLKLKYDKIYSISILDFESIEDISKVSIRISNTFIIENDNLNFNYRKDNSFFELENSNLIYKKENKSTVFNLGVITPNSFIYINAQDTIYKVLDNTLYLGRVDSKLDLQIPKDMTYNNTKYIETTYLTSSEYLIEVLTFEYLKDTQKNKVSISLKNSLGETYYLNSQSKLQTSDSEIFIDISEIKKNKISFELTVEPEVEFILLTLNDIEGHHKKSNIIIHPKVDFKEVLKLENQLEKLILIDDKISIINNSTLEIKESLYD